LAISRCLTDRSIEHVVLERGEVANSWRTERWDSLRLLTPNWQSRLPGYGYEGDDPDGFRTTPEIVAFIDRYARVISAPVQTRTRVISVRGIDSGYQVTTDQGEWRCRTLVLATGACNVACVPACAAGVPPSLRTITPMEYRNPDQLEPGGVLVVGASATGIQLANEIHRSGRPVTLSVGEHIRAPRIYRGKDIHWWMDVTGVFHERYDQIEDIVRARRLPSLQLVGSPEHATLDLNALTSIGVKTVGRLAGVNDGKAQFSGSLRNQCALSDLKMGRLLDAIDLWATDNGMNGEVGEPMRFAPTMVEDSPPLGLDLTRGEIETIVWATGYRPDYSWIDIPEVKDGSGLILHRRGVTPSPGLTFVGLTWQHTRGSALLGFVKEDAAFIAETIDARRNKDAAESSPEGVEVEPTGPIPLRS